MAIHPRSEIDATARIADECEIGPGVVIGLDSVIEPGVELGPNVIIGPGTTIKANARIYPGAVIGTEPQDLKFDGSPTKCEIGERTVVREYCTINRGTHASGATFVGSDCMLMSYTHIAHDCRIGNHVITASGVMMGGHCVVHDRAIIGGGAAFHQFIRVGKLAMVGGMSGLRQDAPPFMITAGHPPARVYGVNSIGLRRNGVSPESRKLIKEAFKILYRSDLNFADALAKVESEIEQVAEINYLVEFFRNSKRGVSKGTKSPDSDQGEMDYEGMNSVRLA